MPQLEEVYIVSAVRTPQGAFRGSLSGLSAIQLGAVAIQGAVDRADGISSDLVEEVFMGNVLSANLGQNPARQCALAAGLPATTVCTTINKVCSSGMKAITLAAQTIAAGQAHVVVAGGMESMSNAPMYLRPGEGVKRSVVNGMLVDGLTDAYGKRHHMGIKAEICASTHRISRAQQDDYSVQSYEKAQRAQAQGWFQDEITPVALHETVVTQDELPAKLDREKLATLPPAFLPTGGTVTAGNASALSDGASAVLLMSESSVRQHAVTPLARVRGWADAATEPSHFPTAPALAIPKALQRAGLGAEELGAIEINEAYAVATLANLQLLAMDRAKVNQHGGSVALGHPLGSSGCRIVVTLLSVLKRTGERMGCAAVCNGGGGASALVVERAD